VEAYQHRVDVSGYCCWGCFEITYGGTESSEESLELSRRIPGDGESEEEIPER
jgi:hypothetical protein